MLGDMTVAGPAQVGLPAQSWAPAPLGAPSVPYASWGGRILASLLDGSIGGVAAFLTLGPSQPTVPFLGVSFLTAGGQGQDTGAWTDSGWLVGTVVVADGDSTVDHEDRGDGPGRHRYLDLVGNAPGLEHGVAAGRARAR